MVRIGVYKLYVRACTDVHGEHTAMGLNDREIQVHGSAGVVEAASDLDAACGKHN